MPQTAERLMDVDAFLDWASNLQGKFELHDGRPVAMSPERVRHAGTKSETYAALREAIRRAGLPCRAYVDGITVRVRNNRAFIPDVLVVCPAPPPDAVTIGNPVIVVEVLSPTTEEADHGIKLTGYFSLPSLAHYLILDPVLRVAIHHTRESRARGAPGRYDSGLLRLDPPGLDVAIGDLFEPES